MALLIPWNGLTRGQGASFAPFTLTKKENQTMNKTQEKAMVIAAQHFNNGNHYAFKKQVMHLINSALRQSQIDAIKAAAIDIQIKAGAV